MRACPPSGRAFYIRGIMTAGRPLVHRSSFIGRSKNEAAASSSPICYGSRRSESAGGDTRPKEMPMSIRLVVTTTATPGKGAELAQAYKARCADARKEPGCEQFEMFQGVADPDRLTLLERWTDKAALDTHAKLNSTRPPLRPELRVGNGEREDYEYNRTR